MPFASALSPSQLSRADSSFYLSLLSPEGSFWGLSHFAEGLLFNILPLCRGNLHLRMTLMVAGSRVAGGGSAQPTRVGAAVLLCIPASPTTLSFPLPGLLLEVVFSGWPGLGGVPSHTFRARRKQPGLPGGQGGKGITCISIK